MIGIGPGTRVMVATRPVDFRKGADSLAALVGAEYGGDPYLCIGRGYVAAVSTAALLRGFATSGRHIIICSQATAALRPLP